MSISSFLQWNQAPSVRRSLAVLVVGCILPVASVAAFLIVRLYENERDQLVNNTIVRVRGIMAAVDREIDNARASPQQLLPVLAGLNLPPDWRAAVVDNDGMIVARNHDPKKFAGRQVEPRLLARLTTGGGGNQDSEGGVVSRTLDGIDVFTVYSRSGRSGWAVVLGIPLDQLTAGLRATLAWLIAATLAALAAGLALAWLIGGRIARSVQALIAPAMALGEGRAAAAADAAPLAMPPLYFQEARELRQALHNAAAGVRRAEAEIRENEHRLALVASAAHLGIWVRDLRRSEIWISDPWRALFCFAPGQRVTLDDLMRRVHPDDRGAVQRTLELTALGLEHYDMEYRILLPDGRLRWIGSQGNVEHDAQGRPMLVRGVSLDITLRKQAELDVQQKQKEVTHLARVAVLGELSGALAHELNQPLTAILSNAQAAQRFLAQPDGRIDLDEVRDILRDIVDEDKRAGEVIQRLRRLFDKKETPRQRVELEALAAGVVRLLRNDLIYHGVTVAIEARAPGAEVRADPVQLQQVLINLLMNACDAMAGPDAGSVIVVRSSVAGDGTVLISVIDSGAGIALAQLARIFEPFYTTKERGMGLGLSICRNIADAHEGSLWADNNPGGGASFHLRLPLAPHDGATAP